MRKPTPQQRAKGGQKVKLDKKQLPQIIVLGVLLLACIGFVAFQLNGSTNQKPGAAKKTEAKVSPKKTEPAENTTELVVDSEFPNLHATVARRDPFAPLKLPVDPATLPKATPEQHPTKSAGVYKVNTSQDDDFPVPRIGPYPLGGGSGGPKLVLTKSPEEQVKDPQFVLTGIVQGTPNVAIIRVGGEGRYVVSTGDNVEGAYTVTRVGIDSVTLSYKGRLIKVLLGGAKNAN